MIYIRDYQSLLKDAKEAIVTSRNLGDLKDKFYGAKILDCGDVTNVIAYARHLWWGINLSERGPPDVDNILTNDELPGTELYENGIIYRVHGLGHGVVIERKGRSPNEPSDDFCYFISRFVDHHHRPEQKSSCLLEERFKMGFELKNGVEMDDISQSLKKDTTKLLWTLEELGSPDLDPQFKDSKLRCLRNPASIESMQEAGYNRASRNIKYLPFFRDIVKRANLPEPLEMQAEHLYYYLKTVSTQPIESDESACILSPWRSCYMIDFARDYAKNNEQTIVHILVGLRHELEIDYFWKNGLITPFLKKQRNYLRIAS